MSEVTPANNQRVPLNHNVTRVRTFSPVNFDDTLIKHTTSLDISCHWVKGLSLILFLLSMGCSDNNNDRASDAIAAGVITDDAQVSDEGDGCQGDGCSDADNRDESPPPKNQGGTYVGATPVGETENCSNLIDDDGDGLTDCQDPLCFGKSACIEKDCSDNLDNDNDGLPDCADSDCDFTQECNPETCASYYDCMVALGCDCTHGIDCPLEETEAYGKCQQKCSASFKCGQNCIAALSVETQENISALQGCVIECYTDGKGWQQCLFDECLEEFANCYLVGESTCEEFFFECIYGCGGNPICSENCFGELSAQGYIDFMSWNQCRLEKCDANKDYQVDSQACSNIAGMYACIEVGGSCIPVNENGGSCGGLVDCVLHCESLTDGPCLASCVEAVGIPKNRKVEVATLFDCVLVTCGTSPQTLLPSCVQSAVEGSCQDLLKECTAGDTQ